MTDFEEEGPFGDLLARYRTQTRTSQQKLATCLGVTRTTVVKWEQKGSLPKDRTRIEEIVRCLQLSEHQREALLRAALLDISHGIWNVPYLHNPHFTGRDELLNQLDQQLSPKGEHHRTATRRAALTQPQAIKGLGGIGKTQIAVEYAYRSRDLDRYTHTFWINAANEEALFTSFAELAELLPAFPAKDETDQRKLVAAIKRWLEQCQQHWLLIFDNADDVALVRDYLPQRGNGSVLLTTRAHAVGSLATPIEVETMGFLEGTHLLLRRAQRFEHATDEEINQAGNIVVELDHFPLALDQAGAYIEETRCGLEEYLTLYQTHRQALLARRGMLSTAYPHSVATTWLLSFQQVQHANPAAAELLELCSFLAPDRIPEELFREGAAYWPVSLQQAVADPLLFQQLIADLLKFSLVKRLVEEHTLSIHRLVQIVQRDGMDRETQRHWAERVVQAINAVFPGDSHDVARWPQCLRYLDQAQTCHILIEQYGFAFVEAADVLRRTGLYLYDHGLYSITKPLFQRALAIYERELGANHPDTARSLNNLAALYYAQGKYTEAEPLYQRALAIREQELGANHPATATSLNNLGKLYHTQGKYTEAEPLYQRALVILERELGANHPDTALSLNNLGELYQAQGKYAEAEPLYQRALAIREQELGANHPDTARGLNNLGKLYHTQGKYTEAEPLYQRALVILERELGANHPDTARSLNNLAAFYYAQGKYTEAEPLYQRALSISKQELGANHPATATSLINLAILYTAQRKYAEAELLFRRALSIREQALGAGHPDTALSLNNLAALCYAQGKYTEAEPLYQRALAIREQELGANHPDTARSLNNLGKLYHTQGKYAEAEPLFRRALSISEQTLGSEHLRTQTIRKSYTALLEAMKGEEEAPS
jgi:tetratricopeptide (TPR) repeat protein/transcriptional regulator with XRE-family HTH domain